MSDVQYHFVKGQGWIPTQEEIIPTYDLRRDKNAPGVWRFQVWLVGVWWGESETFDPSTAYRYIGWVDLYDASKTWASYDGVNNSVNEWCADEFTRRIIRHGCKIRLLNVDVDDLTPYGNSDPRE